MSQGDKKTLILEQIRERIVTGDFEPGSRLPSRSAFEQQFVASPTTIQQVFDRLRDDGFINVKGRHATYVAKQPPHLSRYALAFAHRPSDDLSKWPRSWQALSAAAGALADDTKGRSIRFYYDIRDGSRHEHYHQLASAVQSHCLAGLIFASTSLSELSSDSPLLTEPGVPRVGIMPEIKNDVSMPRIARDYSSFFNRALDYLVKRGCKRLAVFLTPARFAQHGELIRQAVAQRGMEMRPYWQQIVHPAAAQAAQFNVQLLFNEDQKVQPDGLIVADDNLVNHVKAGLLELNGEVKGRLAIIAHAAFPRPADTLLPVPRLGFDAREVLRHCIRVIDRLRRGERVPAITWLPAVFEHELPGSADMTASTAADLEQFALS